MNYQQHNNILKGGTNTCAFGRNKGATSSFGSHQNTVTSATKVVPFSWDDPRIRLHC